MKIGLIGLQNSGKTKLFSSLSSTGEEKGSIKTVKVPDKRLDELTKIFNPKKTVYATLEITDSPGLGLSSEGKLKITNDFLNNVKNSKALFYVIRNFENESSPHPLTTIDPIRDLNFLESEFLFADMALVESRIEKLKKDFQKSKNEQIKKELPLMEKMQAHLEKEIPLRYLELDENEKKLLSSYQFITIKPAIAAINFEEKYIETAEEEIAKIKQSFDKYHLNILPFFAKIEAEISQLDSDSANEFMKDLGLQESSLQKMIRALYEELNLYSFFTVGEDECRAWTITKGSNAQEAAGEIHSDFYAKFIRAEVVHYEDFIKHGSFQKCKEAGAWRLEGKEYIVKDGDIMTIRHN